MSHNYNYFVCFSLSMFFISCTHDELQRENENANLNRVKQDLELKKFSNVNISENVAINWESIKVTEKGNFKISEISASEKTVSTLESKFLENHLKYQIVTIESGGQLYSYFVEVFTNKGSDIYPETITKLNNFTGTLNVFLLNGENLGAVAIYKGKGRDISEHNNLNVLTESINSFLTKSDATNKMPQCGGNHFVFIDQTISRFDVWTVGDKIVAINYVGTTTTRTTSIMAFPCDGLYDKNDILNQRLESYNYKNGSGGGISAPTPEQIAKALQKQIDATKLDACTKDVLEKLKNLEQSDIASMINRFSPAKSIFNIKISTGATINSQNSAETTKISDYNYNIVLNSNYTNGVLEGEINSPPTMLSLATTVTHEIMHAYLLSIVDEYNNGNFSELQSFPTLFDAYVKSKTPAGSNQPKIDAQHDLIASQYVNSIASTIEEFNTGIPVTSGFPRQVYIDIAWAGLEGTYVFNKNYPNDQNNKNYVDRNRILSRGSIEKYNKPRGNQTPVGKPCK